MGRVQKIDTVEDGINWERFNCCIEICLIQVKSRGNEFFECHALRNIVSFFLFLFWPISRCMQRRREGMKRRKCFFDVRVSFQKYKSVWCWNVLFCRKSKIFYKYIIYELYNILENCISTRFDWDIKSAWSDLIIQCYNYSYTINN